MDHTTTRKPLFLVVAAILGLSLFLNSQSNSVEANARPYLGRWDLTLKAADREYPSWLEISESHGKLSAQMVGRWGNA